MMSRTSLPMFLWGEAMKMANHILNRVPSKAVEKTPFQMWTARKPSLNHLHVWGCKAKAKLYNPAEKKLDSRTLSCNFIGFPEKLKGDKFYPPTLFTRILETNNAKILENNDDQSCIHGTDVTFEEENEVMPLAQIVNYVPSDIMAEIQPIPLQQIIENDMSDDVIAQ